MLIRFTKLSLILSFSMICSTILAQEKDRSTGLIGKTYQDLTTHYNYYFNSKLDFNENLKQLSDANKDNYNEILSIEEIGDAEARKQGASFDNVIKRTSLAIALHDNSKWADDCYLLMAKSHYMKGDYKTGIETFQYIISEFTDKKRLRPKKANSKSKYKKKPSKSKSSGSKPSAKDYNKQKKKSSKSSGKNSTKNYNKQKKKAAKQRAKNASSAKKDKEEEVYEELEEEKEAKAEKRSRSEDEDDSEDIEDQKKARDKSLVIEK